MMNGRFMPQADVCAISSPLFRICNPKALELSILNSLAHWVGITNPDQQERFGTKQKMTNYRMT
jgi:hypothetical protein